MSQPIPSLRALRPLPRGPSGPRGRPRPAARRWALALLAAALALGTSPVRPETASVRVTAVVLPRDRCTWTSASSGLDFGPLQPQAAAATATATLRLQCQGSSPVARYAVSADTGENAPSSSGTPQLRHVENGALLPYRVEVEPAEATIARHSEQTITLRARMAGQDLSKAPAGTYQDRLVITLMP
ncbi:spore coat protein U domain-containing protein [Ideonella livida]|uniref:Fimbrial major subunit CsuA/B family protein n=1 Tax=Ideonella livida TaxID=2707176 RepID=A0A7C9TKZ7_9BURK|nr:spore coat protein U domain-containing protein [Ideonella livida]NDY92124.1 fimbrial major subunit CsuA/B family protein [Ideonella livida]